MEEGKSKFRRKCEKSSANQSNNVQKSGNEVSITQI